jgi:hypothetical protein
MQKLSVMQNENNALLLMKNSVRLLKLGAVD